MASFPTPHPPTSPLALPPASAQEEFPYFSSGAEGEQHELISRLQDRRPESPVGVEDELLDAVGGLTLRRRPVDIPTRSSVATRPHNSGPRGRTYGPGPPALTDQFGAG